MDKNIKNSKIKHKFLSKIFICLTLMIVTLSVAKDNCGISTVLASEGEAVDPNEGKYVYLSDMPIDVMIRRRVGYGSLLMNQVSGGSKISLIYEGNGITFDKGIFAHASSDLIFDLTNYSEYDYFTAFLGLNTSAGGNGNGAIFHIYTSNDIITWDEKYVSPVLKGNTNSVICKIELNGAKYLRLQALDNGANGNDHTVYGDAKLIKASYKEPGEDLVPSITELDQKIKNEFSGANIETNKEYELTLLKRELINRVGNYTLKRFLSESEENRQVFNWLTSNVDNIRLYVLGGTPEGGSYYNSLTQLSRLYSEYSDDFTNNTPIVNDWCPQGMTRGDLYKKMAITLSLTHSQRVGLWMQGSVVQNQSDALRRYAIYKYMYENGRLNASVIGESWNITKWFEALQVEEMRFVMNNIIDDEEILWLNAYVQDNLERYKQGKYLTPHPYIAYVWPNYQNEVYYDSANEAYFNELFSINKKSDNSGKELVDENGQNTGKVGIFDTEFTIPGGKNNKTYTIKITKGTKDNKIYKVWMNFRNKFGTGCVCGGISKSGSNIRATHGIPATVIGQPGHAALLYYTKDAAGRGYWNIDNDVSGWTLSEKGERMLLGWGNASFSRGYSVVYMALSQEALNDYSNFVKCEEQVMLAKVYDGDLAKQEEIYRKALEIQPINIDAWVGLINVYNSNENKKEIDYYNLAKDLAENLKYFPLPMQHLTDLIKPKITSIENSYRFTLLQTRILTEGTATPNNTADNYYVYQPSLTRLEANHLLGKLDKTIATFSFDGADAGKIVLSSRFDGNGIRWDYSLDGKQTWNEVSFTAEEEHKLQLTPDEVANITPENDIYIHIVGVGYEEENLYKIDITNQDLPANLFASDLENRIIGVTLNTEWRYTEQDEWTSYSTISPDLTSDKTVQIRQAATGTKLPSSIVSYSFTKDNQPDTRKYVPVSHLSISGVSTEATSHQGHATNAIDANYNTRWHSAWNGTDTQRYIIIKTDNPIYLSAVEFVPAGGGNGKIYDGTVYGSMDGENWEELSKLENLTYKNQANTNEEAIDNIKSFEIENPKQVQYIKIVADRTNANWFTARAFNIYQDLTKNPHPTAGVAYSTKDMTNQNVVARLINLSSTNITITSEGGDSHTFEQNGTFTFTFVDNDTGKEGSAKAVVDWIDKVPPTATIEYNITTTTEGEVCAKLIPNENVTVTNNATGTSEDSVDTFTHIFSENGEFTFEFVDAAGNKGTATASVNWIVKEEHKPTEDNPNKDKFQKGDVDKDGELTLNDLGKLKLHYIEEEILNEEEQKLADVDNDGEITINDIAQMKLALIDLIKLN